MSWSRGTEAQPFDRLRDLVWGSGIGVATDVLRERYARCMRTISQRELRNDSGQVLREVEQGEELTVTRRGTPVARIVPLAAGAGVRRARRRAEFFPAELVRVEVSSADVLADLRGER